jgi:hypothetical protein
MMSRPGLHRRQVHQSRHSGPRNRHHALLEGLPQDLQDMAAALGQFIQEEHPVVGQRHLARPRHVAPPISPTAEMLWFHTDQYDASKGVMPAERHHALTKYARQAPHLERFNHTLRQRLSRLVRGTFSFPSNEPTTRARERISSTTIIS